MHKVLIAFSQDDPLEGIRARLVNDENMFEWEVALFGPPDTLYQGGYFKAHMKFPRDYPYSPPSVRFVTKVWHPNVYEVSKQSKNFTAHHLAWCIFAYDINIRS